MALAGGTAFSPMGAQMISLPPAFLKPDRSGLTAPQSAWWSPSSFRCSGLSKSRSVIMLKSALLKYMPRRMLWPMPKEDGGGLGAQGLFMSLLVGLVLPIRNDDQPVGLVGLKPGASTPGATGKRPVMRLIMSTWGPVRQLSASAPGHLRVATSKPQTLTSRTRPSGPAQCSATLRSSRASLAGGTQ